MPTATGNSIPSLLIPLLLLFPFAMHLPLLTTTVLSLTKTLLCAKLWKEKAHRGVPYSDGQLFARRGAHAKLFFFCCALLACHEGRGRSPSVSGIGEKPDFLTFQLNCKNIQQIKQQCKQINYFFLALPDEYKTLSVNNWIEEDRNRIGGRISHGSNQTPTNKTQKPTPNQTNNTKQQTKAATTAREIRKKSETVKQNAPLSAPHMFSSTV